MARLTILVLSIIRDVQVILYPVSSSTQVVGPNYISKLTIQNASNDYTSTDNVLAYRPNHSSNAGGNTAIVFINLEAAIPCYQANNIAPICHLFTFEEHDFQYGKLLIQASSIGNNFTIFGNDSFIATYGFGITGCSTFDLECVGDFQVTLVCLLPPALNRCGIWN